MKGAQGSAQNQDLPENLENGDGNEHRYPRVGQVDPLLEATDPLRTDVGGLRAEQGLPQRVRGRLAQQRITTS